jgi:hypothetical protein
MALIMLIVAVKMKAKATLKVSRHIFREMLPMLSVFATNITALKAMTLVKILPVR